jgi:prepilin-type N-terminal cleavage/methylation domain-containing protein
MTRNPGPKKPMPDGMPARCRGERGFTLLEMVIGLALISLVGLAMIASFTRLSRVYTTQNVSAEIQQVARAGIDYMSYEIRMAGLDPFHTAASSLEEISPGGNKIRFSTDRCNIDIGSSGTCESPQPDGDCDDKTERITYFFDADARVIRRCLYEDSVFVDPGAVDGAASCQPLIDSVVPNSDGTPLFVFLDADGNAVTDNAQRELVHTVVITLTIEEPAGRDKRVKRTYARRVVCRNLAL